ncbi:hypothetical protein A8990_17312 [Paenibacillus taihuensis]|uniref:Uncharacterized protein n=1 Tax=Paenibacillus taihuensis TaxID=1156355 RepID=A0A3D9Q080_9BACL|nr:hypothetical protein [Paenibacillus taihuensis]REE55346.1 hypothetical protein A8990_17312 [Paenibacillus taihuensis]
MNGYDLSAESTMYRNKKTGELVNDAGDVIHSRSSRFGKLIIREGSDTLEEISIEEFKLLYEKVSRY